MITVLCSSQSITLIAWNQAPRLESTNFLLSVSCGKGTKLAHLITTIGICRWKPQSWILGVCRFGKNTITPSRQQASATSQNLAGLTCCGPFKSRLHGCLGIHRTTRIKLRLLFLHGQGKQWLQGKLWLRIFLHQVQTLSALPDVLLASLNLTIFRLDWMHIHLLAVLVHKHQPTGEWTCLF